MDLEGCRLLINQSGHRLDLPGVPDRPVLDHTVHTTCVDWICIACSFVSSSRRYCGYFDQCEFGATIPDHSTFDASKVFAALVLHRIRNQILVGVGCITYVISFLLLALDGSKNGYWPFVFPALVSTPYPANGTTLIPTSQMLIVWGADLHFNVANVSHALSTPKLPKPAIANPNVSDVKRANPHPKPFPHQTHN